MTPVQDPSSASLSPARPLPLFLSALKVGTIGFGGGAALIPVVEDEFVQKKRYISPEVFTQHVVVSNVTPGAQPVKLTALAAARSGIWWAPITTGLGAALPGTVATIALLAGFAAAGPAAIRWIEFAALGITAFIIVLLIQYIGRVLGGHGALGVAIALAVFAATGLNTTVVELGQLTGTGWRTALPQATAVQVVLAVIACAGLAAAVGRILPSRPAPSAPEPDEPAPTAETTTPADPAGSPRSLLTSAGAFALLTGFALAAGALLDSGRFLQLITLSTLSSFGGGAAYIGVADGMFVATGEVPGQEFYGQAVPLANALPGPVLVKIAAALGFLRGATLAGTLTGLALAAVAMLAAVCSCSALALAFQATSAKAARSRFIRVLSAIILPAICGLLLTTIMSMLGASMEIAEHHAVPGAAVGYATVLAVIALQVLRTRTGWNDLVLIAIAGTASITAMAVVG